MKWTLVACAMVSATAAGGALQAEDATQVPRLMMRATYRGCLQSVSHDARSVLTRATIDERMPVESMRRDAMNYRPAPLTLDLRSKALNFGKHAGHEVRVTGYGPQPEVVAGVTVQAFSVTSIKSIGKTCQ